MGDERDELGDPGEPEGREVAAVRWMPPDPWVRPGQLTARYQVGDDGRLVAEDGAPDPPD